MKPKIAGTSKLSMLMACASPGSALAFHLGLVSNGPGLPRRTTSAGGQTQPGVTKPVPWAVVGLVASLTSGLIAAVERCSDKRLQAERERYLAQAQNASDLEARMRDLHSGRYWLP